MFGVFDVTLIITSRILLFGASFIIAFASLAVIVYARKPLVRRALVSTIEHPIYFGGIVLILVIVGAAALLLENSRLMAGLIVAALLVMVAGAMDETNNLKPSHQLLWQLAAVLAAVIGGWTIRYISNPWQGGVIFLDALAIGPFLLPGGMLAVGWLLLLMNAMNWLDGVDGLASAVGFVAFVTLALVSLLPSIQDSTTLTLALIGAGAILGFLIWNFPPARVYLGTTGAWFLGLYLGLVAIVGGGKVVTTLLVLALPVLDLIYVSGQRILAGSPPWAKDRERHLHHRLLQAGLTPRGITMIAGGITVLLGAAAVVLETQQKIVAFVLAASMLGVLSIFLVQRRFRIQRKP